MKGQYAGDHIRKEGWHAQSGGGGEEKAGGCRWPQETQEVLMTKYIPGKMN